MEKALRLDPRNANASWNQGISYMFLRDYEQAVMQLERAISLAPDFIETYYWLAETYRLWDGSPERARGVVESMPRKSHQFAVYAWLNQNLYEREFKQILDRLRTVPMRVLEMPRHLLPTAQVECECLVALSRPGDAKSACERAIQLLEEAVKDQPNDPRIHSALGKTYALLGREEEAIREGREAVMIWPVSKDALDGARFERYLAEIYTLTGESELATAKLEYLLSIPSPLSVANLRFDPVWDPLRDHPRFQALLEEYEVEQ